jgi:UPF0755 protein|tara:strand:- start:828 stop:1829 length:1002 start_codon:yes stop_codon:yes gene_type:complete
MRFLLRDLSLLISIILIYAGYSQYSRFVSTPLNVENGDTFIINSGSNLLQISHQLTEKNITPLSPSYLYWYGRYKNTAHLIKAGEYRIEASKTLPELLTQFIEGEVVQYTFTIIEGITSKQLIASLAADKRLVRTLKAESLKDVLLLIDGNSRHGEGEFAPDTYYFSAGTTDRAILKRAHKLMQDNLAKAWLKKADNLPYETPYEALIMASIIEKETGNASERSQIAGVFVRRLEKGMRLQSDPTVIYGMGEEYTGNISKKDLMRDTTYNTYTRQGLPPSPIALTGKAAIEAALNPAGGDSLYFVAMGREGRHVFSSNLAEHNKAVRKYQLKK